MPRLTNNKQRHIAMLKRTDAYAKRVGLEFSKCVGDMLALFKTLPVLDDGVMFSFDNISDSKQYAVERLLRRLQSVATLAIQQGIVAEWEQANKANDQLVQSCFGKDALRESRFGAYVQRNLDARDAFINRHVGGLDLSSRIWKSCTQLREEMEVAMTVAIGEGMSASNMSRKVRQYLKDPDLMFRRFRYKDENGDWHKKWKKRITDEQGNHRWIDYDKDSYRVGRGNYRSSAKNAMRVARTETNMAYREADNTRMQQLDFVLGREVKTSNNHGAGDADICDELAGKYPKDFKFIGWHPQCRCYMTTILADWSEIAKIEQAKDRGEQYTPKGMIDEMPDNFNQWIKANADKIADAEKHGTLPYFLRENKDYLERVKENTSIQSEQEKALAQALNIKQGKPMTHTEANELRGNPHYSEDIQYRVNCQSSVVAYEMRRRGFDVEAYGNTKEILTNPYQLSIRTEYAWVDKDGNHPKLKRYTCKKDERYNEFIDRISSNMKDGERYHVQWTWNGKQGGHIITAEKVDGVLKFYDPQSGKEPDLALAMDNIKRRSFKFYRVDNLQPNVDIVRGAIKPANTLGATPTLDNKQSTFWMMKKLSNYPRKIIGSADYANLNERLAAVHKLSSSERVNLQREIIADKSFKPVKGTKNVWSAISENDPDYERLMQGASKLVARGYNVYLVPNPHGIRTADYILTKNGFIDSYDLKTIMGKNSVSNRLFESIGQTNRIVLNMATQYNPRTLAADIRDYFINNKDAQEVKVLKGKKEVLVNRSFAESKNFIIRFAKQYGSNK